MVPPMSLMNNDITKPCHILHSSSVMLPNHGPNYNWRVCGDCNQQGVLISTWRTSHEHNKDLNWLRELSPGMQANTGHIQSTQVTSSNMGFAHGICFEVVARSVWYNHRKRVQHQSPKHFSDWGWRSVYIPTWGTQGAWRPCHLGAVNFQPGKSKAYYRVILV